MCNKASLFKILIGFQLMVKIIVHFLTTLYLSEQFQKPTIILKWSQNFNLISENSFFPQVEQHLYIRYGCFFIYFSREKALYNFLLVVKLMYLKLKKDGITLSFSWLKKLILFCKKFNFILYFAFENHSLVIFSGSWIKSCLFCWNVHRFFL